MADFFDELGSALKKVAQDVRTEVSVTSKEQQLKEAFQTLGRLHFQAARQGKALSGPEFSAAMEQILQLQQQIRQLRDNQRAPRDEDFADLD